ncbi:hypothetical protein MOC20_18920 [Bacillus spizizenii]|nr:hypothetical protein [Bacillus spizizenii]
MSDYTECPKCRNDSIKVRVQEAWIADFSVKTGKCIKRNYLEPTVYHYVCKCGWMSGDNVNSFEEGAE